MRDTPADLEHAQLREVTPGEVVALERRGWLNLLEEPSLATPEMPANVIPMALPRDRARWT